jgi:hypothetical protein
MDRRIITASGCWPDRPGVFKGANAMASPQGPTKAIAKLLFDELRELIRALPDDLQKSVPEQLKLDTGIASEEDDTPKQPP